jgi:hypothetical protein
MLFFLMKYFRCSKIDSKHTKISDEDNSDLDGKSKVFLSNVCDQQKDSWNLGKETHRLKLRLKNLLKTIGLPMNFTYL